MSLDLKNCDFASSIQSFEIQSKMPPKRKPPTKASSSSAPAPRRSKLAKEHSITAAQELEIADAFALFQPSSGSTIRTQDVRRCLIALNCPPANPADLRELLSIADSEGTGQVAYEDFVAIAAAMLNNREAADEADDDEEAVAEEVVRAFRLFTRGEDRVITLADLQRVGREIREEVPDAVLKDMVREATGGGLVGVGIEDFEGVMRRAGVFG